MRFLISGGGTGGHVYPALTVAAALQKRDRASDLSTSLGARAAVSPGVGFVYVGRAASIEERLARAAQIPFEAIGVGGIRGMAPWTAARNLVRLAASIWQTRAIIRDYEPHAIFATGGYVSAPVIIAGALERVPSVIYLPDLEPGWAIRFSARWAKRVAVSFEEVVNFFPHGKTIVTGYPVRAEFFQTDSRRARAAWQLDPDARAVTFLGGSRGAHAINLAVADHLAELAKLAQLVCIAGLEDEVWLKTRVRRLGLNERVRVFGYLDQGLPDARAAADLVVARAGASVLGELPALGLPAILVPYPYAGRHQELNARFLVGRGAAVRVDNADLDRDLVPTIERLLSEPGELQKMRDASHALAQPHAAEKIAELVESVAIRSSELDDDE